jgi:hypothetical protein
MPTGRGSRRRHDWSVETGGGMGEMSTVEILGGSGPFYRGGMAWEVGRRG